MMKVTQMWSVRLVGSHGLGMFDTLWEAEAFAANVPQETEIGRVELHEMVR
jgi:hypothetical protein